jgi:DNA repair/transcription protein MET18/MMS19
VLTDQRCAGVALGFLAATLKCLDPNLLRVDQGKSHTMRIRLPGQLILSKRVVQFLSAFFGSMFSHDHKAGIEASTQALRSLRVMKKFNAEIGMKMLEDVLHIQDDFSKQPPGTRREIYELLLSIVEDTSIRDKLDLKFGQASSPVIDLVQMCQRERDPQNLLIWFRILRILVGNCSLSDMETDEVFQAFANYFPISINKQAAPVGVTTEDLKVALRDCFASHQRLASLAFPFLLERLDRGDAVVAEVEAVSIKVRLLSHG